MENMFPKMRLYVSYRQGSWDKFFCEDEASQEHTHTLFTHMNCSMPACVCVLTYIHLYTQKYIHGNPFVYTHECIHTYIHIYIIYIHTSIYTTVSLFHYIYVYEMIHVISTTWISQPSTTEQGTEVKFLLKSCYTRQILHPDNNSVLIFLMMIHQ